MMAVSAITDDDIDRLLAERNAALSDPAERWRFDAPRRQVIKSWDDTQSCPGSGKTTLVAAKLLLLAEKWREPYSGVCALTHTNVARDEILDKVTGHPAGFKLTAYPHFIGTIQEFVNRFLGLPYVRASWDFRRLIEDDEGRLEVRRANMADHTIEDICYNLYRRCDSANYETIKDYLGTLHFLNAAGDLRFFKQHGSPETSPATSSAARRTMLAALKEAMCRAGLFHFRDMYAFAERLIAENPDLIAALRARFPVVLIDEMQDTQKFQDELLRRIFDCDQVHLQRLGDPDQAIFDGIGGEEPNDTFNGRADLVAVTTTHRFGTDIAEKITGLSYARVGQITSSREPQRGAHPHTIFLYDENSCTRVLESFAALVARADPGNVWRVVKAVGGLDGEPGQIRRYCPQYDRKRTPAAPRPQKLIHAVHQCASLNASHVAAGYELLVRTVADLLRKANIRTPNAVGAEGYFSPLTLTRWLRMQDRYDEFRKLLSGWMLTAVAGPDEWSAQAEALRALLDIPADNHAAARFLEFDPAVPAGIAGQAPQPNIYRAANGRKIAVGTIHSVKGETHDATLILETKYRTWFDCLEMLPFMLDPTEPRPPYTAGSRNKDTVLAQYMRKLFVAGSRPRHLLCMAVHSDHLSAEQRRLLAGAGWSFEDILPDRDAT